MIVVIADDITGAAEMGGIALRYGLKTMLSNDVIPSSNVDVFILYTNTRSLTKEEAVETMRVLTTKVNALHPAWVYKKTDSVLRGHVLAELDVQMNILRKKKALLVPANPSLGRTIKNGQYFLNGQPLHQTGFSADPEFPIRSSSIVDMLGASKQAVNVLAKSGDLPTGVSVGSAVTMKDIQAWATHQDPSVFLAGAASFFFALLGTKHQAIKKQHNIKLATPVLLVSGTTYQENVDRRNDLKHLVSYMPSPLLSKNTIDVKAIDKWADETLGILSFYDHAVMAIGNDVTSGKKPKLLKEKLSAAVNRIMNQTEIKELLIEGGSTAYSIIQELGLVTFAPTEELSQGVVRMKAVGEEHLYLTIKPGSYEWPKEWHFN